MAGGVRDPVQTAAAGRREAEQIRDLMDNDDHRDAGQETGDDRRREELGNPSETQQPHEHHQYAHHHCENAHEIHVPRGADRR